MSYDDDDDEVYFSFHFASPFFAICFKQSTTALLTVEHRGSTVIYSVPLVDQSEKNQM